MERHLQTSLFFRKKLPEGLGGEVAGGLGEIPLKRGEAASEN